MTESLRKHAGKILSQKGLTIGKRQHNELILTEEQKKRKRMLNKYIFRFAVGRIGEFFI